MADVVEREKIQEVISDIYKDADSAVEGACIEIWSRVKEIPAADVVSRDAFNRILAENDDMRTMLAQIGKKPGDSMADVRPVGKAAWEQVEVRYEDELIDNPVQAVASMFCPNCQRYHNEVYFYGMPTERVNFCPNCGADMREES